MRQGRNTTLVDQSEAEYYPARLKLIAFLFGLAIAFACLSSHFSNTKTDFEDAAAMGAETTTVMPSFGGHKIHCYDGRDAYDCISGVQARKAERSVLWLGNSQLHAINQWKPSETNAAAILFESLKQNGLDLTTFSQPNANLQEHYILFEYLRRQIPVAVLILPLVFDDTREDGLRPEVQRLARAITSDPLPTKVYEGTNTNGANDAATLGHETAGIADTMQERAERFLNNWLAQHSQLWVSRPEMRGWFLNQLYILRNSLFGIKPTTKRKLIRGRYIKNLTALEQMLSSASKAGITVVMYVAPIRNDVEIPYVEDEYRKFKSDAKDLAQKYHAELANLESLVTNVHWGNKDATRVTGEAELDFMHFQAGGHKALASRIHDLVIQALPSQKTKNDI